MFASASRRDNPDRSQARSAWESATQRSRPVGYGVIGAELIPEVFLVEMGAVFLKAHLYESARTLRTFRTRLLANKPPPPLIDNENDDDDEDD
jgi:hypothetical protein